jgi:hypothetical protein
MVPGTSKASDILYQTKLKATQIKMFRTSSIVGGYPSTIPSVGYSGVGTAGSVNLPSSYGRFTLRGNGLHV